MAGGLDRVLPRALALDAEAVQVFPASPRRWPLGPPDQEPSRGLGRDLARADLPLFAHAIYLVNLATPDPELAERSAQGLAHALAFGALAGAAGVVTHAGSNRAEDPARVAARVAGAVARAREVAARLAGAGAVLPRLLLEGGAGAAGSAANTPAELARLLHRLPPPVGVCLDTAHLFAAGQPVHTREGLDALLGELDRWVGFDAVGLVHLNDSRSALGSGADRHENLWEGQLGREGLARWVQRPELAGVAFVLETPGFDGKGPDRRNLGRARRLRVAGPREPGGGSGG